MSLKTSAARHKKPSALCITKDEIAQAGADLELWSNTHISLSGYVLRAIVESECQMPLLRKEKR